MTSSKQQKKTLKQTRKTQRKEDTKLVRDYIKAKAKAAGGYRFAASKDFTKRSANMGAKSILALFGTLSLLALLFSILNVNAMNNAKEEAIRYETLNKDTHVKLQPVLEKEKETGNVINKYEVSNSKNISNAAFTAKQVVDGMFEYQSGKEYQKNRDLNLQLFDNPNNQIKNEIYASALNDDGSNKIDNLELTSEVYETTFFSDSDRNANNIHLTVFVKYKAKIANRDNHSPNAIKQNVYDIQYDVAKNKITDMKRIMRVQSINTYDVK